MGLELGTVAVAGRAEGLPTTGARGVECSSGGGSVAAACSEVVLGSCDTVVRAEVGSRVGSPGSGDSAVVGTGLVVLRLPIVVVVVRGLSVEVTTAAGCSATAANTEGPRQP